MERLDRKEVYLHSDTHIQDWSSPIPRAAERYNDVTPEERQRRRERGWGNPSEVGE